MSANNVSNGSWIIVSYGAYLQEPNIRMCMEWIEKINHEKDIETSNSSFSIIRHIKLCDFGVSGELVFIHMNTFAGRTVAYGGATSASASTLAVHLVSEASGAILQYLDNSSPFRTLVSSSPNPCSTFRTSVEVYRTLVAPSEPLLKSTKHL
ncbi:hypothetical protein D9758_013805 [Tetrapyrgos nigripes]|uniref:Uncharacterized protein n=1 Tax=Tetrapyrgos nigripes TaxID=182062 RepID=A0A8H5FST3_9AGAR|nr:hypothetical protein D9758_013805 [Tetrapyrgos nigripes]